MSPRILLIDPVTYFERPDRLSLSRAAAVVVANAILFVVFIWWFVIDLFTRLDTPPAAISAVKDALFGQLVSQFFGVFIGWLLVSGVLHVVVWLADGEQMFGVTLAVVGITDLVSLVLFPLTAAGLLLMFGTVPSNPTQEQTAEYIQIVVSGSSATLDTHGYRWRVLEGRYPGYRTQYCA